MYCVCFQMSDPYKTPDFVKAQRWITLSMSVHNKCIPPHFHLGLRLWICGGGFFTIQERGKGWKDGVLQRKRNYQCLDEILDDSTIQKSCMLHVIKSQVNFS